MSAFFGRNGSATVRFSMAGVTVLESVLAMFFARFGGGLFEERLFYEQENSFQVGSLLRT
jgi:hypothetical protein